ncbi:hypothetical protein Goarm_022736 [Gossypium armourianum]|uniref:RNase H type-1 domain-containing protein n=1 Tax=Gossypium armourianum TaxID=34283 RepID=A0A7J9KEG5_9ROSI|nr:hypothetical protein [Gossypium armourianum]
MAEARACLKAVSFAKELGFRDVCVEGDTFTIIKKLESVNEDRSIIGTIVQEIRQKIHRFRRFQVGFVTRGANATVHGLAMERINFTDAKEMEKIGRGRNC